MSSKVLADRAARSSGKETAAAGPKGFRHLAVGLVAVLLALAGSVGVFSASGLSSASCKGPGLRQSHGARFEGPGGRRVSS